MMQKLVERLGKYNSNLEKLRFLITCLLGFSDWQTAFCKAEGRENQEDSYQAYCD